MIFFSLISTAISSIFYGVIATFIVMAILYAVLAAISRNIVHSIPFYITGVILALLLSIQFSLLIGAFQAKHAVGAVNIYLNQLVEDNEGIVGAQDSQFLFDRVTEEFPIIGSFVDLVDFSGHEISELPDVVCTTMNDFFSTFIWHRVGWIAGFIVLGCLIPMLFDQRSATPRKRTRVKHTYRNKYDDF